MTRRNVTAGLLLVVLGACGGGGGQPDVNPLPSNDNWVHSVDGTGERWGRDVAISDAGSIAHVGAFNAQAVFSAGLLNEVTLESTGGWNSYIALYDENGDFEWARSIEGEDVFVQAVAVDDRRSIAVAGYTSGTAIFRFEFGIPLELSPPAGASEVGFLALLDEDGNFQWVKSLVGDAVVQALDVDYDRNGDVIVGGVFTGTAFLGDAFVSSETVDGFVLEYAFDGNLQSSFVTASQSPGFATIWTVSCFDRGDVLIAGDFEGTVNLGPHVLESVGSGGILCARVSPDDGVLWANALGGPGLDSVYAADVSQRDAVVLAGQFVGTAYFGETGGVPVYLTAQAVHDAFVARFDEDGALEWAKAIGGSGGESAFAVGLSREGQVVVTGTFDGSLDLGLLGGVPVVFPAPPAGQLDAFLAYYADDGELHSAFEFTGVGQEFGMGAVVSQRGNLVASGATTSDTTMRGVLLDYGTIRVTGDRGAYLLHFNPGRDVAFNPLSMRGD